jgi:uncharacterized protein (TIGR03083 family)
MDRQRHLEILRQEGGRLSEAASAAGLDTWVPSCPQWRVRDLVAHIGGVHRWAASHVELARKERASKEESAAYFTVVPDDQLIDWYDEGRGVLAKVLESADPSVECWTFLPASSPLDFWTRRQAHETAIHRADAQLCLGTVTPFEPDFAADGIDELLCGFLVRPGGKLVSETQRVLGVVTEDTTDSWTVRIEADRREVALGLDRSQCVVRGTASDLYLLLWNRIGPGSPGISVEGDEEVLALWREKATV